MIDSSKFLRKVTKVVLPRFTRDKKLARFFGCPAISEWVPSKSTGQRTYRNIHFGDPKWLFYSVKKRSGQVSAWQSAALLPISCTSVSPVPSWVEEPVSPVRPVRQSSSGGVNEQSTLSPDALI